MYSTARIAGLLPHSLVNGPGVRFVVFFQGCNHNCQGCHNPETHDKSGGKEVTVAELIATVIKTRHLDGITLSGGDPLLQSNAARELAKAAHELGLNVWCYTGYTYEEIEQGKAGIKAQELLSEIDVLVDGRFVQSEKPDDPAECIWRGSRNQRLIDVPATLQEKQTILFHY